MSWVTRNFNSLEIGDTHVNPESMYIYIGFNGENGICFKTVNNESGGVNVQLTVD